MHLQLLVSNTWWKPASGLETETPHAGPDQGPTTDPCYQAVVHPWDLVLYPATLPARLILLSSAQQSTRGATLTVTTPRQTKGVKKDKQKLDNDGHDSTSSKYGFSSSSFMRRKTLKFTDASLYHIWTKFLQEKESQESLVWIITKIWKLGKCCHLVFSDQSW